MHPLHALQPQAVWQWFADICAIPHPTYQEAALAEMIVNRAKEKGLDVRQDEKGSVYIRKPAHGAGMAGKPGVILQGHIDMVAQKTPDSSHNFATDPIRPQIIDGWVHATQTTLGADNGIGAAMGLAVAFADDIEHPPLEVLLTLEEETGMGGARAMRGDWLQGRYLINLDTEEAGCVYVGCAGGRNADLSLPFETQAAEGQRFRIEVAGMHGGHSGIDIHRGYGNAIKVLADLLVRLPEESGWRLASIHSGELRNVIPSKAEAEIVLPAAFAATLAQLADTVRAETQNELGQFADSLTIQVAPAGQGGQAASHADSRRIADLLAVIPNGVLKWSEEFDGVVDTSNCLSVVHTSDGQFSASMLLRSLRERPKDDVCRLLGSLARLSGATLRADQDYTGWEPHMSSVLLKKTAEAFAAVRGEQPQIEVVHAGLECGLMQKHLPNTEMISFGPTIKGAHSPKEKVEISTVEECWRILLDLLQRID
ncbi:beta-Ala-His dipeptidase [Eikenella sp. S3360]|uniref:Beta-Ala-His dipeptidase n=1 Tax=Eikenella glucosivorans TaxID=2766967 RepID=A0ABS0N7Q0_9NEIS|nr:beta-Ala-His dipeptidase [Eikenella glucosivorans]MBH5328304.1 beta-Ala-His dipeptidase [Eikenella glucosivorans]